MQYISTRDTTAQKTADFTDILIRGLAPDGGLYVPKNLPKFTEAEIQSLRNARYTEVVLHTTHPFIGNAIPKNEYSKIIAKAYQPFQNKNITPLCQIDSQLWGLELFHGPTLAFKDIALQLLGRLFDYVCQKQNQHVVIVGSTSGDTGPAAISAFAARQHADIFMLFPYKRTSDIQRKQMTTINDKNVHPIALKGTFDDCQNMVKAIFARTDLNHIQLSAVNSINWARIMAQIAYYAYASLQLASPKRPINISVPTGNFGNVLAAYCAKKMGFYIGEIIVASNENDILTRFFAANDMRIQKVKETLSPSMDIQISSNFERMLFWLLKENANQCRSYMLKFQQDGNLSVPKPIWQKAKQTFHATSINDAQTIAEIKELYNHTGNIFDPHSAIAIAAAKAFRANNPDQSNPTIAALTAHPAKFPSTTQQACHKTAPLPPHLQYLNDAKEKYTIMENNINDVTDYIQKFAR